MNSDSQSFYSETGYESSVSSMYSNSPPDIRRSTAHSSSSKHSSFPFSHSKIISPEDYQNLPYSSNKQESKENSEKRLYQVDNVRVFSDECVYKRSKKMCVECDKNEYLGDSFGCCKYNKCSLL